MDQLVLWAHTRYVLSDFGDRWYLIQLTVTVRAGHADADVVAISEGLAIADPAAESYRPFELS